MAKPGACKPTFDGKMYILFSGLHPIEYPRVSHLTPRAQTTGMMTRASRVHVTPTHHSPPRNRRRRSEPRRSPRGKRARLLHRCVNECLCVRMWPLTHEFLCARMRVCQRRHGGRSAVAKSEIGAVSHCTSDVDQNRRTLTLTNLTRCTRDDTADTLDANGSRGRDACDRPRAYTGSAGAGFCCC